MTLPNGGPWPPPSLHAIAPKMSEWDAWYTGDPTKLRTAYQRAAIAPVDRPAQYRGGASGMLARMWWGRPTGDLTKRHDQLHIPLASDICQASAALLFSEPPSIKVEDLKTQERIDDLVSDDMLAVFSEAAEVAAALGGAYLRVTWDVTVADEPFFTVMHADAAVPEFRWGRLVAVTFWRTLAVQGQTVIRHLERHELDSNGIGIILHGLYEGTADLLGQAVPLTAHPSTESLALAVDEFGAISTETPGLAVTYLPNQRPQRRWRTDPVGASLGRSDLDGIEPLMDALDETYSSWMRDIRLGKARIIVPEFMLENLGVGLGAGFDADREVFTPLSMPPSDSGLDQITAQQFVIRHAEHKATCDDLIATILRTAGYSHQTFGEGTDGAGAVTATEVTSKERRSYMTRDSKIRILKPRLAGAIEKLLAVDAVIFNSGCTPERPEIVFADSVQADPESLARTAQALRVAQAASTLTLVTLQHPDWDEAVINEEVARILAETGMSVPNPETLPEEPVQEMPDMPDVPGMGPEKRA